MRKFLEEVYDTPGSRRTGTSSKADHPGVSQHNMTTPCDSGDTVNEAAFRERASPYPGRSDRHGGLKRRGETTLVDIADGATGPASPGGIMKIPGVRSRNERMGNHSQECVRMSSEVSACQGNVPGERSEVSRGHRSPTPFVMGGTW